MTLPAQDIVERLLDRAKRMNGALVGASDGGTYALGYYDQFAAADDKEAADTISRLTADNEALRKERDEAIAKRESADGMDGAVVHAIREVLYAGEVPAAPFIDDHVGNAIVQRNQARARVTALEAALLAIRETYCHSRGIRLPIIAQIDDVVSAALGGSDHG